MKSNMRRKSRKRPGKNMIPFFFLAPHLIIFVIFFFIPMISGILVSFTRWDMLSTPVFVGFDNYKELLFDSNSIFYDQVRNGLKNTFTFVIFTVPFCVIVPLLLAVALNAKPRLWKLFQSIFYMPSLFAISAVIIIWTLIFNVNYGPINNVFHTDIPLLGTQPFAWMTLVIVTVWWCIGGNMVIYQAALNAVSKDCSEAADIDGANSVQKFFNITLPSIKSQIIYTVVITTINQFNIYGQPLMLTNGGPTDSTRVMMMYVQQNAFGSGQSIAGMASAMAVILGLCIMAVSAVQFRLLRTRD